MSGRLSDLAVMLSASPELAIVTKATVALVVGLLAVRLARHARASVRHVILAATFAALVVLPLAAPLLPAMVVSVPVTRASVDAVATSTTSFSSPVGTPHTTAPTVESFSIARPSIGTVARVLWIAGMLFVSWSFGAAVWQLSRLRRTSLPWIEGRRLAADLAAAIGIRRSVDVLLHEEVAAPLTCGLRHPAVIFPDDASEWDERALRRAFVHELEHVRRRDWWIHLSARAVCAAYWFHPVVWIAYRQLCHEAERACDDAAIAREDSAQYADQLVSLARRMAAAPAQPALAMANRSDLSRRVTAVLDPRLPRGRVGVLRSAIVGVATFTFVASLAPMRIAGAVRAPIGDSATRGVGEQRNRVIGRLDEALVEAAADGDMQGVTQLIAAGANINARVLGDGSPLLVAAREGHLSLVRFLLDRGADPNLGVEGDGSPLIMAAADGHAAIVELLLDRGADPNLGVPGDGSPLIMAARDGQLPIVQLLLDRGAQIDLIVPGDENALIQASGEGRLDIVKLLVSRGANVNARVWAERSGRRPGEWRTPLNVAQRGGHTAVVAFLTSAGAVQ